MKLCINRESLKAVREGKRPGGYLSNQPPTPDDEMTICRLPGERVEVLVFTPEELAAHEREVWDAARSGWGFSWDWHNFDDWKEEDRLVNQQAEQHGGPCPQD